MALPLQNFASLVATYTASAQGACSTLLNFAVGSVDRAYAEANATIGLWVQWLILQVLSKTRAATSVGPDLDSWMADYFFYRLAGIPASGQVQLNRYQLGPQVVVSPGPPLLQVKTDDGTQTFTIIADPANLTGYWNSGLGAYVMSSSGSAMNVLVQAVNIGTQGNVFAGTITLLGTPIVGIDYPSNSAALTGGLNAESDAAFRTRFQLYINSLSKGTDAAVLYAATSVQQGVTATIQENTPQPGFATVTIDDGTGAPSGALRNAIQAAINLVRPVGSTISVFPPAVFSVSINIVLATLPGANHAGIVGSVNAAVTSFVNSLPMGAPLTFFKLENVIGNVDTVNITGALVTINGTENDLVPPSVGVVKISSLSVS